MFLRRLVGALACAVLAGDMLALQRGAPAGQTAMLLQRLQGTVEYSAAADGTAVEVVGTQQIAADQYAITLVQSMAALKLPDSSVVSIGESTRVRAGEFLSAAAGPGSTIAIEGGSLHFAIKHPAGGQANYTFVTPTSTIAVRGTEGLIESQERYDSIAVIDGKENDVTVTAKDGQTYAVAPKTTLRLQRTPRGTIRPFVLAGIRSPAFRQFRPIVLANARARAQARQHAKGQPASKQGEKKH
ncbi:MAG: FecR domain-containing protein [Candidatus Eremiobacteraeota bacterium]|nr:FecR domain-containing protein [Candidatus Eremiobacteraeota bacterium]